MENLLCSVTHCDALCGSFLWLALTASQGYLCNTFRRRLDAKQSICQGRVSRTSETLQILASEDVSMQKFVQEMTETWLNDSIQGAVATTASAVLLANYAAALAQTSASNRRSSRSLTLKFEWFECCTPGVDPQPCCRCFSAKDTAAWISNQMERRFFLEKRNWTRDLSMILIETGRNPNRSKTGLACEKKQS